MSGRNVMKIILKQVNRFNARLGLVLAAGLSTMACFWAVGMIVLATLLWKRPADPYEWIIFLSSGFFQAVALPVLAMAGDVVNDRLIRFVENIFGAVMEELKLMREDHGMIKEMFEVVVKHHGEIDRKLEELIHNESH